MAKTWDEGPASAILIGSAALLAVGMGRHGSASWLEAASFVTGAACVWLTVRENIWNFPIGLVNVATFAIVFLRAGLLADAALQVVYLALGVRGWYLWRHGGRGGARLHVTRAGRGELVGLAAAVVVLTGLLWLVLRRVGGSASFWDALTTSISLGSQWLLNRKRLESWAGWIVVDAIYIPLYISKSLHLTAVLYAVFLGLAVLGLRRWHENWTAHRGEAGLPGTSSRVEAAT
ncbi:nicotinamide riboside transporter PnuC [Tundrisphaera sp. TA3]|uniref:nicotinamide riboside transporter PnuC n=1 Tax=Tundrisphaera sp. TA3 TaxID=3435775 RepID=UPI003EB9E9B0